MLILTRRVGEAIKIADDITVVVLGVKGSQVRLGIEAPQGVAVDRKEIAERKAAGLAHGSCSRGFSVCCSWSRSSSLSIRTRSMSRYSTLTRSSLM